MAKFEIHATRNDGLATVLYYDNMTSELTWQNGTPVLPQPKARNWRVAPTTSKETPVGKRSPDVLKISLGLSCNYECEYCSQRFVPRSEEANHGELDNFMAGLDAWVTKPPSKVEFWGGEPLVYIKTLKPLAEAIKAKYPMADLSVITNGSLLSKETNEWLDRMGLFVGLSHDGPGQHVRGPDPLHDPVKKAAILDLYKRLRPKNRISFNTMMNRQNMSRAAVVKFFVELTGDPDVPIGEGSLADAYDEGGTALALRPNEFGHYRRQMMDELRSGQILNFVTVTAKMRGFIDSLRTRRPASATGQKCGMDNPGAIAVDLRGNVLTCQNVSAVATAPNGESHKIGHVSDLEAVKLKTATSWNSRDECPKCPMLQICHGACMYLEGPLWETTCNNAFSDSVPVFVATIEHLTGFKAFKIVGPHRKDRHDLWLNEQAPPRRVIPITAALQKFVS